MNLTQAINERLYEQSEIVRLFNEEKHRIAITFARLNTQAPGMFRRKSDIPAYSAPGKGWWYNHPEQVSEYFAKFESWSLEDQVKALAELRKMSDEWIEGCFVESVLASPINPGFTRQSRISQVSP